MQDSAAEQGASYVVAIITAPDTCVLAQFDTFKVARDYWFNPLKSAVLTGGRAVASEVLIADHTCNVKVSKAGNRYLDPKKFNQWKQVELSAEEQQLIRNCISENKAGYDKWLSQ